MDVFVFQQQTENQPSQAPDPQGESFPSMNVFVFSLSSLNRNALSSPHNEDRGEAG